MAFFMDRSIYVRGFLQRSENYLYKFNHDNMERNKTFIISSMNMLRKKRGCLYDTTEKNFVKI